MTAISFVRMYPSDWRSGCLGLSMEEEGLYMRICMFQAETRRRVPLDESQAARLLGGANINQYKKVLGQLLIKGKVKRHEDGFGNDRIEHETKAAQSASRKRTTTPERGADRETDQDDGRENHALPVTDEPAPTPPVTPLATPPVEDDFSQQTQQPSIEPVIDSKKDIEKKKDSLCRARASRGTRLDQNWVLPKSWGDWARTTFPQSTDDRVRLEADKFRDFWHAKAGRDACKLDWQATWRNWCRTAFSALNAYGPRSPKYPQPSNVVMMRPPPISEAAQYADLENWARINGLIPAETA